MSVRTILTRSLSPLARTTFRPVVRQVLRRNFMVGLQPGIEEQNITHEAATYYTPRHLKKVNGVELLRCWSRTLG